MKAINYQLINLSKRFYAARKIPNEIQNKSFSPVSTPLLQAGSLDHRIAFVTGGGTGLGKGIATSLAKAGARVAIIGRKENVLEEAVKDICNDSGNENIHFAACDVRKEEMINAALDSCKQKFGSYPDLIVNNAAGNFISPTLKLSNNAFSSIIDIVLKGTINVTMAAAKHLIEEQRGGNFLAISTLYAKNGSGFVVPSAVAKAGVETLTKSLASEWGRYGIRYNAIAPGPIYTEGAFTRLDPTGRFQKLLVQRLPVGRLGTVEEIANLSSYLLSDYASWMTGEIVTFDGGELPYISGEFNVLSEVVSDADWDLFEKMIRKEPVLDLEAKSNGPQNLPILRKLYWNTSACNERLSQLYTFPVFRKFQVTMTVDDQKLLWDLFAKVTNALNKNALGLDYWVQGGSLIGILRHGNLIPWDDDIDILLNAERKKNFLQILDKMAPEIGYKATKTRIKIYNPEKSRLNSSYGWQWPYIDCGLYAQNGTHLWELGKSYYRYFYYSKASIYPLMYRAFNYLWVPTPRHIYD
ncbi:2,4-dienoyl-CoA reductase, mitochondrial, partial [Cichlidogyrus casuarinus]